MKTEHFRRSWSGHTITILESSGADHFAILWRLRWLARCGATKHATPSRCGDPAAMAQCHWCKLGLRWTPTAALRPLARDHNPSSSVVGDPPRTAPRLSRHDNESHLVIQQLDLDDTRGPARPTLHTFHQIRAHLPIPPGCGERAAEIRVSWLPRWADCGEPRSYLGPNSQHIVIDR